VFAGDHHGADPHLKREGVRTGVVSEIPKFDVPIIGAADDELFGELEQFGDMGGMLVGQVPN
jgi:hypothetical protein